MTVGTLMTADELLRLPDDGSRYELVQGELRKMSPTGYRHGKIQTRISQSLVNYLDDHPIGEASSDVYFRLSRNPDTVRAPDNAFVRTQRVSDTAGTFEGSPDVAFEIVSPEDRYSDVDAKTSEYLRAGTEAVVIIDPQSNTVSVHRAEGMTRIADVLELPDILPGWQLTLARIFS